MNETIIKGIEVKQNQQEFLVGVFNIKTLLSFTKYTSRLIIGFDEENLPIYNDEIQREVENSRVEKIADFLINDPEATFPTNIVLHIPSLIINSHVREGNISEFELDRRVKEGIARDKIGKGDIFISIIDGQHRIRGIEVAIERLNAEIKLSERAVINSVLEKKSRKRISYYRKRLEGLMEIEIVVTFFIDKTLEYQAMIFSTINRTQKRVSPSLVYSLFGLTTKDSPQKTALQVVLALNGNESSPFYNRIKLYGHTTNNKISFPLTQATMVKSIINLICENLREAENDRFRDRKELQKRSINSNKPLPFRKYYFKNSDTKISDIMYCYFKAVQECFQYNNDSLWNIKESDNRLTNILQTTVGYVALLKILVDILPDIEELNKFSTKTYKDILIKAEKLNFLDVERYPFTSKSQNILYLDISLKISPPTDQNDSRLKKLKEALRK